MPISIMWLISCQITYNRSKWNLVSDLESLEDAGSEHRHDDEGDDHVDRQEHLANTGVIHRPDTGRYHVRMMVKEVTAKFSVCCVDLPEDGVWGVPQLSLLLHGDRAASQVWGGVSASGCWQWWKVDWRLAQTRRGTDIQDAYDGGCQCCRSVVITHGTYESSLLVDS